VVHWTTVQTLEERKPRRRLRLPLGGWDGKVTVPLTATTVIEAIYARENRRRTIWTPNIVLERMGIARYPNIPPASRRKAARILRELWRAGRLVRRLDLNRGRFLEASYMRPEDKPLLYFDACDKCGFPRLVRHGRVDLCRKCAGEDIDENLYYAASPERAEPDKPSCTGPPTPPARRAGRLGRCAGGRGVGE
jgi:hypothetical protein